MIQHFYQENVNIDLIDTKPTFFLRIFQKLKKTSDMHCTESKSYNFRKYSKRVHWISKMNSFHRKSSGYNLLSRQEFLLVTPNRKMGNIFIVCPVKSLKKFNFKCQYGTLLLLLLFFRWIWRLIKWPIFFFFIFTFFCI